MQADGACWLLDDPLGSILRQERAFELASASMAKAPCFAQLAEKHLRGYSRSAEAG